MRINILLIIIMVGGYVMGQDKKWTPEEINRAFAVDDSAYSIYKNYLKSLPKEEAIQKAVVYLKAHRLVKEVRSNPRGIGVLYKNGIKGGMIFPTPKTR